jgi:hypothetical protein
MRNLALLSVVVLMACGETLPESKSPISLREATCKVALLIDVLHGDEQLVDEVLHGDLSLQDAISRTGGTLQEGAAAIDRFFDCEAVKAPPPLAGNKVM